MTNPANYLLTLNRLRQNKRTTAHKPLSVLSKLKQKLINLLQMLNSSSYTPPHSDTEFKTQQEILKNPQLVNLIIFIICSPIHVKSPLLTTYFSFASICDRLRPTKPLCNGQLKIPCLSNYTTPTNDFFPNYRNALDQTQPHYLPSYSTSEGTFKEQGLPTFHTVPTKKTCRIPCKSLLQFCKSLFLVLNLFFRDSQTLKASLGISPGNQISFHYSTSISLCLI